MVRSCGVVGLSQALHADSPGSLSLAPFELKPWASFLNGIAYHSHKPTAYS